MKKKIFVSIVIAILLVLLGAVIVLAESVWQSDVVGLIDSGMGITNFFGEILDDGGSPPDYSGTTTKFSVKIVASTADGLTMFDMLTCNHCNDMFCMDSYPVGVLNGEEIPEAGTYYINSSDVDLLNRIEHDGTQEWLQCEARIDRGVLVATVYVDFIYEDADTCTYSSGKWSVDCSDNCSISSNVDLDANDIVLTGDGLFSVSAKVAGIKSIAKYSESCKIIIYDGGELSTLSG